MEPFGGHPRTPGRDEARAAAEAALTGDLPDEDALRRVVEILARAHPAWGWVGVYLLAGDTLLLGPYVGPPTEHTRIPAGVGVCGTAVARGTNVVVDDVSVLDNYLACSTGTRSELVVLIRDGGDVVGQFDVDSDLLAAFGPADETLLDGLAALAGPRCRRLAATAAGAGAHPTLGHQGGRASMTVMSEPLRFPIRFSPGNAVLFRGLLIPPSASYVELDDDSVHVRLAWAFSARIPRRLVASAGPGRRPTIPLTAGAHGWNGRWLVNAAPDGIVAVELTERVRAFVAGVPIRLRLLAVSLEDPDGFLAALGAPARTEAG